MFNLVYQDSFGGLDVAIKFNSIERRCPIVKLKIKILIRLKYFSLELVLTKRNSKLSKVLRLFFNLIKVINNKIAEIL
jgi:hypothetical protein